MPEAFTVYGIHELYARYTVMASGMMETEPREEPDDERGTTAAAAGTGPPVGAARARQPRPAARPGRRRHRRGRRPRGRRRGPRGGLHGARGQGARPHPDVAVPVRDQQGRAAPADVERERGG